MEPKSPRRQSPRPKEGSTVDDIVIRVSEQLRLKPPIDKFAFFLDELARNKTELFQQCFGSRSRAAKLIQESPNEQYILMMLKYTTADPQALKSVIEQRISSTYLLLNPEFTRMASTQSLTQRDQQALQNIFKIQLIYETILKRYNVSVPANVLLRWMAIMPGDLKSQNHIVMINDIVKEVCGSANLELNYLLDLVATELSGSGSMAIVLVKYNWNSVTIAEGILQYSSFRKVELSKLLRILSKNYKTVKFHQFAEQVIKKLNQDQQLPQLAQLFVNFVKTVLFVQMSKDILYFESEKIIKEILANEKLQLTGTLNYEEFNWLITNINKNHLCEHILLLQSLAKRCLPANMVETFTNYLDKYLDPAPGLYKTVEKMQVPSSAKDLTASNQHLDYTMKPTTAIPKTTKDLFGFSTKQVNIQTPAKQSVAQDQMPICHDYIGLPNIGNSCYINSFIMALSFCRQSTQAIFKSRPKEKCLQYLRNLLILICNRQKNELKANVTDFKKNLPEDFSAPNIQMDTMEFGRCIIDKISSIDVIVAVYTELLSIDSIICPKGDIIEKRVVQDSFMILSFEDPKLFSKIQSKIGEIQLNSMIVRDYFTPSIIEGDFQCEVCKLKYNKRQKRQRIVAMPTILIVVLARFTYDINRSARRKVCDRVKVDNWLMFGNITSPTKPDNYKLVGFINHMGKNAQSGHYQAYTRHPKRQDRWLNFDDDFVTESIYQKVVDLVRNFNQFDTPYVLFYERS